MLASAPTSQSCAALGSDSSLIEPVISTARVQNAQINSTLTLRTAFAAITCCCWRCLQHNYVDLLSQQANTNMQRTKRGLI